MMVLALPPATGEGYDPSGPRLWEVRPWRDGVQETWPRIHDACARYRREDEAAMDARAAWVLPEGRAYRAARAEGRCCAYHREPDCCDPDDCGPCCEECPTCPALACMAASAAS